MYKYTISIEKRHSTKKNVDYIAIVINDGIDMHMFFDKRLAAKWANMTIEEMNKAENGTLATYELITH